MCYPPRLSRVAAAARLAPQQRLSAAGERAFTETKQNPQGVFCQKSQIPQKSSFCLYFQRNISPTPTNDPAKPRRSAQISGDSGVLTSRWEA